MENMIAELQNNVQYKRKWAYGLDIPNKLCLNVLFFLYFQTNIMYGLDF